MKVIPVSSRSYQQKQNRASAPTSNESMSDLFLLRASGANSFWSLPQPEGRLAGSRAVALLVGLERRSLFPPGRAVTLLIVLVLVTLVLFALFLGGSLIAQGYLYQAPAERLPLRALAGAVLVGSFITLWVAIDARAPQKYDTFFEFAPYKTQPVTEFEAIRWESSDGTRFKADAAGNPMETSVKFKRGVGGKNKTFYAEGTDMPFVLNTSAYMTAALKVKPDEGGDVIRFNAKLAADKRTYPKGANGQRAVVQFVEDKGSRYIQDDQVGVMFVPSNSTVFLAILINALHFVAWFAAFWLILHFTPGHALAFTALFGLVTMLLVMPLLFKPNRVPKPADDAPKVALVMSMDGGRPQPQLGGC